MSEEMTMFEAYITGIFPSENNGKGLEAYEITVLYSDGSKMALRKTYPDFIELQGTVNNLLTREGGFSKKTAKSLVKTLPELNNYFPQSLFKEDDLKKIERLENFIKELLILPAVVRNSESVNNFFGAFMEEPAKCERSENEDELKQIVKEAEVLSGRYPFRPFTEVEVLEKRSGTQGKEKLSAMSERTIAGESDMEFHVEKQQKSLSGTGKKESEETKSTEMNRRVKLVSVEAIQKRKTPDKNYVYILKVLWSDGSINIIYRQCSDFFFLQENLKKEFPKGSGREIPMLKGRKFSENCQFCFKDGTCKRRQSLNNYFHNLINAPDDISNCKAVLLFCRARLSDLRPHGTSSKTNDRTNESNDPENVEISGPVVFEQYIVIADYKKKNKNDISLTAGDTVDVIEKSDFGWWLVDREGELGWAPASHLEPTDDGAEITASKTFAPGQEEAYQSMQSYEARAEDELSFDIGVTLKVVQKNLDGWWLARYQGKEGWVPAVFLLRVVESDVSSPSSSGKICGLGDIVSSERVVPEEGDSATGRRSPPTRRSMVQRTIKKKPNKNTAPLQLPIETKPKEKEQNQEDTISFSSGYHTSSSSSLSSLVSDVSLPETESVVQCALLGSFDSCVVSSAPRQVYSRSNLVTTLAQDANTSGSSVNGGALSSGRRSPIPSPISKSPRRSPQPRIDEIKATPGESISEKEQENDSQNTRYQAMYTYISQEKNEITINEGDIVEVVKRCSNGWWLLASNNQLGWGPSNFLQPVYM